MTATRPLAVLAVAAALLLPAAPAHAACDVTVGLPNFSPATRTVQAGATVTWCWSGNGHNVTGPWGTSGDRDSGDPDYTVPFTQAGTLSYQCTRHPETMQGTIVVEGSQPSPTTSPTPQATTTAPAPARTTTPPARTTAPASVPAPPPTTAPVTPTPTTAAPTTSAPPTPAGVASTAAAPDVTPAAQPLDPAPPKPRTGLAIAVGLLVAAAGVGGAVWLLLRGRAG